MEKLIITAVFLTVFCAGCLISNSNEVMPEFVENLYEKESIPDSLGIEFQFEIIEAESDTINIFLYVVNTSEEDVILTHSGTYANFIIFKGSKVIYPTFDLDKWIYTDDLNESMIQAQSRIQVVNKNVHLPKINGTKVIGFAPFRVKENTNKDKYWLVSEPMDLSRH